MIEPLRTLPQRDEDIGAYRPLAALSVASLAVSLMFVVLAIVLTIVGLVTKRPVLEAWLIAFAGLGVVMALAARWQLRLAEGTRAGQKMANWALSLSVLGVCVYGAY